MSDKDLNTLIKMPLKNIFESEYWTQRFLIWAKNNKCGLRIKQGAVI